MIRRLSRNLLVLCLGLSATGCPHQTPPTTPQEAAPPTSNESAMLIAPECEKDVGNLDFGVTGDCTFTIENGGKQPLTLTLHQKSCSCSEVEAPARIAPGEKATATIRWTPTPGNTGEDRQFVTYTTNDPRTPLLRLDVVGHVKPAIRVSPEDWAFIDFEKVPADKPAVKEIRLFSTTLPSFTLKPAISDPGLSVETKSLQAGEDVEKSAITSGYLITLRTSAKATPGYLYDKLTLEVQAPDEMPRQIILPVHADIENKVFKTTPMQIEFAKGLLTDGEMVPLKIEFAVPSDDEEVAVVRTEPAFVKTDVPKRLQKGMWEIGVRLATSDPAMAELMAEGFFEGRLFVKTKGNPTPVAVRVKWVRPEF